MRTIDRITFNPMDSRTSCNRWYDCGSHCCRTVEVRDTEVLPYLEPEDIGQALAYAAWRRGD